MRTSFSLCVFLALLSAPTACFYSKNYGINNVIKVDCLKLQNKTIIPNVPNVFMRTSYCDDYKFNPTALGEVIIIFVERYSETFEVEEKVLWSYLNGLEIEVSIFPRQVDAAYDSAGNLLTGKVPVSGLALSDKKIWVEIRTSQIWSSSLIHELVHIIIWNQNMGIHGDPDHEGKHFSGWTEKHTKFIKMLNLDISDLEN